MGISTETFSDYYGLIRTISCDRAGNFCVVKRIRTVFRRVKSSLIFGE